MTSQEVGQRADDEVAREFAKDLMSSFKLRNKSQGINLAQALWTSHRLRAVTITLTSEQAAMLPAPLYLSKLVGVEITQNLVDLVVAGNIESAYVMLKFCTPDDMSQDYHWLNADRLAWIRNQVGAFLGWETLSV